MEKLKFPVHKLNDNISKLLSQIKSARFQSKYKRDYIMKFNGRIVME